MSSSWQLHTILLMFQTVLMFQSSSQQVAEEGECLVRQNGPSCPPSHSNYKTTPLTVIQSKILQKLSSIQLDLTIITSELSCRHDSGLLNATRSTISAVIATDFRALFSSCHGSELVCCSGHDSKPNLCNCNGLIAKCLGGQGLKFLTSSWRELVDNLRTSLRILLSEESNSCALPSSGSYLSKLHGSRDLGNWMQCSSASGGQQNCLQVAMATAPGSQQQLTSLLTSSSERLKLYWPTTTTTTTTITRSDERRRSFGDDQLELGSGFTHPRLLRQQSDQDNQFGGSGGGGLDGMITDDEDLLGGGTSEFGSGDSDTPDESTPPPQEETILVVTTTSNSNNRESSSPRQLSSSIRLIIISIAVRLICR